MVFIKQSGIFISEWVEIIEKWTEETKNSAHLISDGEKIYMQNAI